jgi:hypothetical protein
MGDPPGVPELQDEAPFAIVDRLDHRLPGLDLGVRPDAGGERVADRAGGDVRRLGDHQAGVGALRVIVGGVGRHPALLVGAAAGEGRHHDAVREVELPDPDRLEQPLQVTHEGRMGEELRKVITPCGYPRAGDPRL